MRIGNKNLMEPAYQRQVLEVWQRFAKGENLPADALPARVLDGWELSRKYGLSPTSRLNPPILGTKELAALKQENRLLLEAAQPMLGLLAVSINRTGYIATLAEASGVVLEVVGNKRLLKEAQIHFTMPGANKNVRHMGSSAMTTSILLKKPVAICGYEHFNRHEHNWKCAAAPIFDQNGAVVASLTLSGDVASGDVHAILLAKACADGISSGIRERVLTESQQTLTALLESVHDSIPEIVIAVDCQGQIIHANRKAHDYFLSELPLETGAQVGSLFTAGEAGQVEEIVKTCTPPHQFIHPAFQTGPAGRYLPFRAHFAKAKQLARHDHFHQPEKTGYRHRQPGGRQLRLLYF